MGYEQLEKMYAGNTPFRKIVDLFEFYIRMGAVSQGVLRDAIALVGYRLRIVEPAA